MSEPTTRTVGGGPTESEAIVTDGEVDEARRQIANLLRTAARTRPWIQGQMDDAESGVMLYLLEHASQGIWHALSPALFGTEESRQARRLVYQGVQAVSDRLRGRRRVEIKPGQLEYDPTRATQRQRRTLAPDKRLSGNEEMIADEIREEDVRVDVRSTLQRLGSDELAIVQLRVLEGATWEEIACRLGVSVSHVRSRFAAARSLLAGWLDAYREGDLRPPPGRP